MLAKFGKKEVELKFTFNSFKYMAEFDLSELASMEYKPFKIISIASDLLLGAANCDSKVKIAPIEVERFIEEYVAENSIHTMVTELVTLLEESAFFKSLQEKK